MLVTERWAPLWDSLLGGRGRGGRGENGEREGEYTIGMDGGILEVSFSVG